MVDIDAVKRRLVADHPDLANVDEARGRRRNSSCTRTSTPPTALPTLSARNSQRTCGREGASDRLTARPRSRRHRRRFEEQQHGSTVTVTDVFKSDADRQDSISHTTGCYDDISDL